MKYRINASELGIFGAEFCCVVVGTEKSSEDNRHGHIAAVVTGLGKSTSQAFEEYFAEYLGEVTFLCSDGYEAYSRYFENAPMVRLKEVAKVHHIKGYTKMTAGMLAKEICKLPEVNDVFLGLVAADKLHSQYVGNLAEMLKNDDENKG